MKSHGTLVHLIGSIAILVAIVVTGLRLDDPSHAWVAILLLITAFALVNGHGITGSPFGVIIDSRNKMSLSRLQMLAWTIVVISALAAAILWNIVHTDAPMDVTVPSELWVLLGISSAGAIGGPAILANKGQKEANTVEANKQAAQSEVVPQNQTSIVVRNNDIRDARFADLLRGDEVGNALSIDIGKLQMFFFTFILAAGYGAAIFAMLKTAMAGGTAVQGLPKVQEGMNVLLGISQTGYLAIKATPQSKEPAK